MGYARSNRHIEEQIPALPYTDAPDFYKMLRERDEVSARALRFLMLTITRVSEVRFATADEISRQVWNVPGSHTGIGKGRRIPLGREALRVVDACTAPILFQAERGKPISDMSMSMIMRREGLDARPHGFRATFRTWAEEATDADYETMEACLGYAVATSVQAAYKRSDRLKKQRKLLEAWQAFLMI